MLIANPIYDAVFKYLLDDNKVARLFIGAILGAEISELEFKPQEVPTSLQIEDLTERRSKIYVFRMDFKARITYSDGTSMLVLVELQKIKADADLTRFRRYLGSQYLDAKNSVLVNDKNIPLPIITIYFLGYSLRKFENNPIIKVKRQYIDNYSQEIIMQKDHFIEALTHDSVIIQIPKIKHKRRNELEELFTIFEEDTKKAFEMRYVISEKYDSIVKRLNLALSDEEVRHGMLIQEEVLQEFENRDKALEVAKAGEKKAIERENEARDRETQAIKNLMNKGMSLSEIGSVFKLSEEEIRQRILYK
jgi:hypothetical protein